MAVNSRPAFGVFLGIVVGLGGGWLVASIQRARDAAQASSDICAKQMEINELKGQIGTLKYRLGDRE